jgi:hypothetical protein
MPIPQVRRLSHVPKRTHVGRKIAFPRADTYGMETAPEPASKDLQPMAFTAELHPVRLAAVGAAIALLWTVTQARLAPLILLTGVVGLAVFSIHRSVAQGNRSTKENVVIASVLIGVACVWGVLIAGPLFFALPVAVAFVSRKRQSDGSPDSPTVRSTKRQPVRQ